MILLYKFALVSVREGRVQPFSALYLDSFTSPPLALSNMIFFILAFYRLFYRKGLLQQLTDWVFN